MMSKELLCGYRADEGAGCTPLLHILAVRKIVQRRGRSEGKAKSRSASDGGGKRHFCALGYVAVAREATGGLDFRALYEGAGCLLHHCDPYNPIDVRFYYVSTGDARLYPVWALYTLALLNYLPTIYPFTAPFALLPWDIAQLLWTGLTALSFLVAAYAMWRDAKNEAPLLAGCLIGFLLANSEIALSGGNAAGFVVGLCVLAAWCFLHDRFAPAGVLCLAASLAMKPHDAGLVWLYFLLAGASYRKRAWQTLAVNGLLGIAAIIWVSLVAPHWMTELRSTMAIYAGHGGANDPGITGSPDSSFRSFGMAVYPGMVCNLQSIVAVFCDDPKFYNPFAYLSCAQFLVIWMAATLRSSFSMARAYLALAAIVPFTLLVTYHRTTDTKLLLLAVPACALLWSDGGVMKWLAVAVTGGGIFITGDIPLVVLGIRVGNPDWAHAGFLTKVFFVLAYRPVPVLLLVLGVFYLRAYVRSTRIWPAEAEVAERGSLEPAAANGCG
jgi:hypothetical protein